MQPRAVKGPPWVNEPQPGAKSPEKKIEGFVAKGDWLGANPTSSKDALSDLEWTGQRVVKFAARDSDANICHPPPTDMAGAHQLC